MASVILQSWRLSLKMKNQQTLCNCTGDLPCHSLISGCEIQSLILGLQPTLHTLSLSMPTFLSSEDIGGCRLIFYCLSSELHPQQHCIQQNHIQRHPGLQHGFLGRVQSKAVPDIFIHNIPWEFQFIYLETGSGSPRTHRNPPASAP